MQSNVRSFDAANPALRLYMKVPSTRTLGPFQRYAIWVQGCPFRCPNCMTPESLPIEGGEIILVKNLVNDILTEPDLEGLTISGGEPFLQAAALAALIDGVRKERDMGVIVYSGYQLQALRSRAQRQQETGISALLERTDLLIDGVYIAALNDGRSLRGSSNQVVHALTDRYATVVDHYYGRARREVEIHLAQEDVMLVGVPGAEALAAWHSRFW